jgi:hypothetical protein
MVVTIANVSWSVCREHCYACFHTVVTAVALSKLISYPGIVQAAGGSFKKTHVLIARWGCCFPLAFILPQKLWSLDPNGIFQKCTRTNTSRCYISRILFTCDIIPLMKICCFLDLLYTICYEDMKSRTLLWRQLQHVRDSYDHMETKA